MNSLQQQTYCITNVEVLVTWFKESADYDMNRQDRPTPR